MRGLLLLSLLLAGLASAAEDPDFRQRPGSPVPRDAVLRDETGRRIGFGDLLSGRPLILALVYYRCRSLCGIALSDLQDALHQGRLTAGRDYDLLAVSFDPADTPADAAAAKARYVGADWHFLIGEGDAAGRIERSVGFSARYDAATDQFLHPAGFVLLTPDGRVADYLLGVGYDPERLAAGLRATGQGIVAAPAPPVRLLCFRYDPVTGRIGLAVLDALKLVSAVGALVLVFLLYRAVRRERR